MTAPMRSAARRWPPLSTWAGALCALGIAAAALTHLLHERRQAVDEARERVELLARVLDEQAVRQFDAVSLALAGLAHAPAAEGGDGAVPGSAALRQTMAGQPLLRAVAVLDRDGRVLASTEAADIGYRLPLARLGPLPEPGGDRIGPYVAGYSLRALGTDAAVQRPAGSGFVPLLRPLGDARRLLLVALIDVDALTRLHQQTVGAERSLALLATADGRLLAASGPAPVAPGVLLPALRAWAVGPQERGSAVGAGVGEGEQVLAFRRARARPLLTLVQMPLEVALEPWVGTVPAIGALAAAAVLGVLAMTSAVAHSRRARGRAQAAVGAREREMSLLVGSVQELIFRTDEQGRLTFMNPYWQTVSALPVHALLGRPLADGVAPASRAAAAALFEAGGAAQRRAQIAIGDERGLRQFDVQVQEQLEGGRRVGFVGSAVDVTGRLAGQALLREQLAFNELLLEMLPVPVSMLDARGRYVLVNQAWEEMTGRSRAAVLGQPARQLLPPADAELHERMDRELQALGEGAHIRYDAALLTRHGVRRDVAITKAAMPGPDGRPGGVLVAFMDVTEQREVERAVREARDAAEEASRSKSEFIANISHELRTPLQSIIGFSELGERRGQATPLLASMFGDIHRAGQRMLALVNDLLDVSRIESTVGTFHLERTDLRPQVREVVHELAPLLAARQLGAPQDLGTLPLVAKVDPMRLQQVVRNVLANAIRFSPPGSAIDIGGELTADNEIHLTVRDRGPGIPPAELESIFEAFVQSTRTKDGSGGTGLGLAICRKIVEAHGGRIEAANADGGGSLFRIVLPARSSVETQPGVL